MKKIILAATALLFSTGAFAQHFEYGAKTGLSFAKMTKFEDTGFKTGIYAGAFAEYVINDFVGVQAELLYSMQGARWEAGNELLRYKFCYVNLPIFAKIYVSKGLSVDLGPQFGYMVSAKIKFKDEVSSVTNNVYDDGNLKKFDISAAIGLSYKFAYGLEASARYNLGLTKVIESKSSKNSVFQIGLGYRF